MAVLKDYNESTLKWEGVGAGYISNDDGTNKATPNEVRAMKDKIDGHAASQSNPHATNKSDVGLGNVDNVKQASKAEHDVLDTKVSEHVAEKATLEKLGHVKAETDSDGKLILDVPKSKYNAIEPPTADDDETQGYSAGSTWFINHEGRKLGYICIDATEGVAIWQLIASDGRTILYTYGEECENLTGGWVEGFIGGSSANKLIKNSNHIRMQTSRDYADNTGQITVVTNNKIDISGIDTLFVDWLGGYSSTSTARLLISESKHGDVSDALASVTQSGVFSTQRISELDVRTIQGEYYIQVTARGVGASSGTSLGYGLNIYRIWGE